MEISQKFSPRIVAGALSELVVPADARTGNQSMTDLLSAFSRRDHLEQLVFGRDGCEQSVLETGVTCQGQLDSWTILNAKRFGAGSFATTHLARNSKGESAVAKIFQLKGDREQELAAFQSLVPHPNIVNFLDTAELGQKEVLFVERAHGISLYDLHRNLYEAEQLKSGEKQFSKSESSFVARRDILNCLNLQSVTRYSEFLSDVIINALAVMAKAAEGLSQQGVIHGDLRPQNFIVNRNIWSSKVIDLGLVTQHGRHVRGGADLAQEVFAPEQYCPRSSVDDRTDVFLLGGTIAQCFRQGSPPVFAEEISLLPRNLKGIGLERLVWDSL
ncbi:MAG: protein kinase family protein, partial [Bdellovibrionales bacterium]|nr:protein kinase family protein [Bdellovibrionales bacterium]